jgi:hydrogenase 3 maturation protease
MSLEHLKEHLSGKVVILGMGNTLRCDDGAGSLLACRIKDKLSFIVYDAGSSPENYLGKIIKDNPATVVIIDAADLGLGAGEFQVLEPENLATTNLFSTHNSSLSLIINYLQSHLKADIILLIIQPQNLSFGDNLSPAVSDTLTKLETWFGLAGKK